MSRKSQVMAEQHKPVKSDALATTVQVAEFLHDIPPHTLEQWRSQGKGPKYIKVGRHVRYRWSDVQAWLDAQSVATA